MKNYIKQNKKSIIKYTIIILLAFILGVYAQPGLNRAKQNVSDMTKPKPVTYQAIDLNKLEVEAKMREPEFVLMMTEYASGLVAREHQVKLDREATEQGMKADKALTSFAEKYDATLSAYTDSAITTSKEAVKDAIRNSKM